MVKINHNMAQAAVELAVFGAIIIFILGTIVRSSVGNSYTQNQNFKAMRMAMLSSWQDSEAAQGLGAVPKIAHNSASILFVEDRLSPDFNKYGDLDRDPFIASGSGTFTYNLLYPMDVGDPATNSPIMDVYINGQHFPFTTAVYTQQTLTPPVGCSQGTQAAVPIGVSAPPTISQAQCLSNQSLRNAREWVCGAGHTPYKLFYTMVPNGVSPFNINPPFCANPNSVACKDKALSGSFLLPGGGGAVNNGDMQYDLVRNGDYATVDNQFPVGGPLRNYMAWQWAADAGTVQGDNTDGADPMIGLDPDNQQYPTYDIDGRLKEVTIYKMAWDPNSGNTTVTYEDPQGGDIDSSWDLNSCGPKPGLQTNSQILTFNEDGTYLQVREGKMYNPETGQEVRSSNRRNSLDVVQREIQLSNNTGRFCSKDGTHLCNGSDAGVTCANPNPVEVCVNGGGDTCFNGTNTAQTCYDTTSNIIFVRSRLENKGGSFWMTNASGQLKVQ